MSFTVALTPTLSPALTLTFIQAVPELARAIEMEMSDAAGVAPADRKTGKEKHALSAPHSAVLLTYLTT